MSMMLLSYYPYYKRCYQQGVVLFLSLMEMGYQREQFYYQSKQTMDRKHKSNIIQPTQQPNHTQPYESLPHFNQPIDFNSPLQYSTVKKMSCFAPSQNTSYKPRLKVHMKTQMQTTPKVSKEKEFVTSRKKKANWNGQSPLAQRNVNMTNHQRKNKTMVTQFYTIDQERQKQQKKSPIISQVLPAPRRQSLLYNKQRKQSFIQGLRQQDKPTPTKSKKKISFTVFQQKDKSRNKSMQKPSPVKPVKKQQYLVPYRYNSTITINLFDARSSRSKERPTKNNSLKRIQTRQRSLSLPKRENVAKGIISTSVNPQNIGKISKTLQTLKSYKFVEEYIQQSQILQKVQGYILANEPQCKWPLLIVDEVFKKIRQQDSKQNPLGK